MRTLRLLYVGWLFHMKMLTRSSFNTLLGIIYPLFFATIAFFMFKAGDDPKPLLYATGSFLDLLGDVPLPLRFCRLPIGLILCLDFTHQATSVARHRHPADSRSEHARGQHRRGCQFDLA